MKNQDMPAMPFTKTTLKSKYNGNDTYEVVDGYEGFTKREQVFKDILCALIASSDIANEAGVLREVAADDLMINADMLTNMYFEQVEL